jgi:hypothetical protein
VGIAHLAGVPPGTFTQAAVGYHHACGLRPDRTISCWGLNADYVTSFFGQQ